ncbi:MAG TPA: RiPP maturation radical SAM C-methyltransferase [Thermoanaerobaculia bacterium]|nr:RiPP maturation radical SAM C-methyltransferase [Thermoanaerobaculia bacterium]HQR66513.1 RiPP maturation radical SAM C-methyltransferase [Thermoanaerobaculia bacterium]
MRLALVSMPFLRAYGPSPALGALSAYLREHAPGVRTTCHPAYLTLWERLGRERYDAVSETGAAGELLYAAALHPERRPSQRRTWEDAVAEWLRSAPDPGRAQALGRSPEERRARFEDLLAEISRHAAELASALAKTCDVVGISAVADQTFASVLLAREIKRLDAGVRTILGGHLVAGEMGASLLQVYDCIDYVIQGEGEAPLVALLSHLGRGGGADEELPATLTRRTAPAHPMGREPFEVADVSCLPDPDLTHFEGFARAHGLQWWLPVESARGCWWDRTRATGDCTQRCLFCRFARSVTYRSKPVEHVAREVGRLVEIHRNPRVTFLDASMRAAGVAAFAAALPRGPRYACSLRANARPREILALREAGFESVHCGLEGLSTSYLTRLHKGTTAIQNLQIMRSCHELDLPFTASLLLGFPGSTEAEVAETVSVIERFARAYPPPGFVNEFDLERESPVYLVREKYGIRNVRSSDRLRDVLPEDVWSRLALVDLSWDYDETGRPADWTPVREALRRWAERYANLGDKALTYTDAGGFLEISDRRHEDFRFVTLERVARELYLHCIEIRTLEAIERHFAGRSTGRQVARILDQLVEWGFTYREGDQFLSLAVALNARIAARRYAETPKPDSVAAGSWA